ncbi:MAG: hypothetical protein JSR86_16355 [Proteobacteria bacterium]|nr:hypothetical protein [Pseudomonadota bacterium]
MAKGARLLLALAALALAAASAGPTATLRLKAVDRSWFRPSANSFQRFEDDHCRSGKSLNGLMFGTALGRDVQPAQVPAGRRMYLRSVGDIVHWDRGGQTTEPCVDLVSFTPEDGHAYEVALGVADRQCRASVVDTATGAPPPDFRTEPMRWTCLPG